MKASTFIHSCSTSKVLPARSQDCHAQRVRSKTDRPAIPKHHNIFLRRRPQSSLFFNSPPCMLVLKRIVCEVAIQSIETCYTERPTDGCLARLPDSFASPGQCIWRHPRIVAWQKLADCGTEAILVQLVVCKEQSTTAALHGLVRWNAISESRSPTVFQRLPLQERFYFLHPMLWGVLFALTLQPINANSRMGKWLVLARPARQPRLQKRALVGLRMLLSR